MPEPPPKNVVQDWVAVPENGPLKLVSPGWVRLRQPPATSAPLTATVWLVLVMAGEKSTVVVPTQVTRVTADAGVDTATTAPQASAVAQTAAGILFMLMLPPKC
ncbi:hypothetical protein [Kitasatospora sp. NPDC059327]|uniref:hypothetical protein n=1 Tax=Kitasatospora sp. NPDC059327 TaxID=3346803 RepID=UPI0036CBA740